MSVPRLKNAAGVMTVRNDGDTANAPIEVSGLKMTGGTPAAGKIATSDASGNASWQDNAAIALANAAQATANSALNVYPTSIFVLPQQLSSVSGNFAAPTVLSTAFMCQFSLMSGNGSQVKGSFPMAGGHWNLSIAGLKSNISGDVQVLLDGVSIATLAGYNATSIPFIWAYDLGTIAAGLHQIDLKVNGKQPSSGGFNFYCSWVSMGII